jgi:gliding motility-associated lipoprotein GldH
MLMAGMCSCDSTGVFDRYTEIPGSAWHKDSIVVFHIPIDDTLQNHNLLIQIRNETSYRFSNLWLFIEITQPGGETKKDSVEVVLADPSGRWLGKGYGGIKTGRQYTGAMYTFQRRENLLLPFNMACVKKFWKGFMMWASVWKKLPHNHSCAQIQIKNSVRCGQK